MKSGILKQRAWAICLVAIQGAILFLAARKIDWWEAWLYTGICLPGYFLNLGLLLSGSPESRAERSKALKYLNRIAGGLFGLAFFLCLPLVAGLDERLGWSHLKLRTQLDCLLVFLLGFGILNWALAANTFFFRVVQLGREKKHTLKSEGPYRFVRHPAYLGLIIQSLALPPFLGSHWAMIPGGVAAILLIIRTALEDRALLVELEGYEEFARRTRYRLVPGIW